MLDLFTEFDHAIDALEHHQITHALCGGLAVTFYTQPRFTQDIEVLTELQDCERGKQILLPLGFKFFSSPMRFDGDFVEVHRLTKIDPRDGDHLFLDLIAAISPIAQGILKQRIRLAWQNKEIWMVSREGLIQLKEVSRRPKDLMDIESLQQVKS